MIQSMANDWPPSLPASKISWNMSDKKTAPYGRWVSEITPDLLVQSSIPIDHVFVDPLTSTVYHIERRADDGGRSVIVNTEKKTDLISSPLNARTSVQEYGGAAAIAYGGVVYFSNSTDNRVYQVMEGRAAEVITPENPKHRFANFTVHPIQRHLLAAILEDHTMDTPQTVVTTLCIINTQLKAVFPLVVGADFYSSPVFNPCGTKLAWIEWYHPDMPWDGSQLYIADVLALQESVLVLSKKKIAGELSNVSVSYPSFVSNTRLIFTCDESGFQNPYVCDIKGDIVTFRAFPAPVDEDFGEPAWMLGNYPYAILDQGKRAIFAAFREGRTVFYIVDLVQPSHPVQIECPFTQVGNVGPVNAESFVFVGHRSDAPGGVVRCQFTDQSLQLNYVVLKSSDSSVTHEQYIPPPVPITLYRDAKPLYVVYYAPKNPAYSGPTDPSEKPPCIVNVHGGPTSMASQTLSWLRIYFTSRGYAWLDVNYGGSSGYGREYIGRLAGNWGVVDVQDCQDAPRLLASLDEALIDGSRVAIRGGSAGGYTTLASLSVASDTTYFKAATSLFGVSDLILLSEFTHKYELKYLIKLLGGTVDEIRPVYEARSPLFHAKNITVPLLVLQGEDDKVVPPEQAEKIVEEIKENGGHDRVKYRKFSGEGHGWRLKETIIEAAKLELEWYEEKLL